MTKSYDALMKLLDEKGSIPDDEAAKLIKEHGPLGDEEKKHIASAIKMAKALSGSDDKEKDQGEKSDEAGKSNSEKQDEASSEVTMDDYLLALSVLDSDEASPEEKEKAQKAKDKFESQ